MKVIPEPLIADDKSPVTRSRLMDILHKLMLGVFVDGEEIPIAAVQAGPHVEAPNLLIELGIDSRNIGSRPHQVKVGSRMIEFVGSAASNVDFPKGAVVVYHLKTTDAFISLSVHVPAKEPA